MKIVGIDPSLASTGLAVVTSTGAAVDRYQTRPGSNGPGTLTARLARQRRIVNHIWSWADGADLAVIEGPAYHSITGAAHERAGLWWAVVARCLTGGVPVAVVAPAARARYATGRGNAGKDLVLAAVVKRYADVDVDGNDAADALILAAMGARHLGQPTDDPMPKTHIAAMTGVVWPEMEVS